MDTVTLINLDFYTYFIQINKKKKNPLRSFYFISFTIKLNNKVNVFTFIFYSYDLMAFVPSFRL